MLTKTLYPQKKFLSMLLNITMTQSKLSVNTAVID